MPDDTKSAEALAAELEHNAMHGGPIGVFPTLDAVSMLRTQAARIAELEAERDALQARITAFEVEWDAHGNARAEVARLIEREECAAQLDALGCDHCAAAIRSRTQGAKP